MTCNDLIIRKGEQFDLDVRFDRLPKLYKAISGISLAGAPVLTITGHGIPDGWRLDAIKGVVGTKQINTHRQVQGVWERTPLGNAYPNGLQATLVDANSVRLDELNAAGFSAYESGGYVEFMSAVDLAGASAKMDIRDPDNLTTLYIALSTTNGRITLDNVTKVIRLSIAVADVNALTFTKGVATLELTPADTKTKLVFENRTVILKQTDITQ